MKIWFAVGCLALVALMCLAAIVTTIFVDIMCPEIASPADDFVCMILCAAYFVIILEIIRRIRNNGKNKDDC